MASAQRAGALAHHCVDHGNALVGRHSLTLAGPTLHQGGSAKFLAV